MKDTFYLWGVQCRKTGEVVYRADTRKWAQSVCSPKKQRVVKIECRIVQPQRKPKRGKYPNDNFGLPAGYTPHNPDDLTREQVGEGFRLLADVEIGYHRELSDAVSGWYNSEWDNGGNYGCLKFTTYRVPINTPLDINPELKTK